VPEGPPLPGGSSLEDMEQRHVRQVLAESSTLEEAAARLGINVTTLWRKRKRWGPGLSAGGAGERLTGPYPRRHR